MNFQVQQVFNQLDTALNQVLANPYVTATVSLFVILYAGLAAPELPSLAARLFDFTLFKMFILSLILLINNYNPTIAILVAVAFFLSLQTLTRYHLFDMAGEILNLKGILGQGEDENSSNEGAEANASVYAGQEMTGEAPGSKYGYGPEEVMDYNEGPGMHTQVSGLAGRGNDYMGPQGMTSPVGYSGVTYGEELQ